MVKFWQVKAVLGLVLKVYLQLVVLALGLNPKSALEVSISTSSSSDNEVSNKPTGFSLYSSYEEN